MTMSRRSAMKVMGAALPAAAWGRAWGAPASVRATAPAGPRPITAGPFAPTWESLIGGYRCPEWFRDAKFGVWAHWTAQCVPEQGDWYARQMYIQNHPQNRYHVQTYGHPSAFGFMELDNLWKAEKWEPERLMALYKRAGARYFFALANHHDNFDAYDSKHHAWNSMNVGPKRDIVGGWAKAARAAGMRFGVSNHSAHAWHWFQTAYDYDAEGPLAGKRYDAFTLTKADGRGKWWEGLDPQELYAGRNMVAPDGITSVAEMNRWHEAHDRKWDENPPAMNPAFVEKWFLRCKDLIDRYDPDVLYFDNTGLPLGQAGLDIAAHFYNQSVQRRGALDVVLNAKMMPAERRAALVEDIERGAAGENRPLPWQTDTCIGAWHYERRLFEQHRYKTALQVVQMLVDIVSKNGNLMLSVPIKGDGTIDEDEVKCLEGIASWIGPNGDGIYGTRPFAVFGETPATQPAARGQFGGVRDVRAYTAEDIRFTTKGDTLYAFVMAWPASGKTTIKTLARGGAHYGKQVAKVELLGAGDVAFTHDESGLTVTMPEKKPNAYAYGLKITPR
jgi:alpha-L-fucosidase